MPYNLVLMEDENGASQPSYNDRGEMLVHDTNSKYEFYGINFKKF